MIKIFDKNKNFIQGTEDYKNIKLEEETSMTSTLSFSIPLHLKDIIEEEGYIEIKDEGSFVIKEININIESISVICKQNLEDLTSNVSNKAYVTKTMQYILSDLLQGTGWTGVADTNISRTVTGVNMSVLDYIYKAIDIFKYEVKFDSVNKKVIAREKIGSDKGVYFHDEVNLKSTNVSSDTYDFVTRIIPIGFDDLGIELINGGKSYVENHSYSNKVITLEWRDERYTVAENLKRDAQLKLDKLCRPLRAYSCSIEDLSKSKEYSILSYEVGDTIDLIDREKGIREKQRITKTVKYLNSEGEDSVEIANRPRIFGDDLNDKIEEANNNISATSSRLELLDDKIIAEVGTINQSVADNVRTINEKIGQLIITDSQISNMVSDLTTIVSDNYSEVNNKIGRLDIKADNINASVSDLNTKVDGNKTETDNKIGELDIKADSITASVSNLNTKVDENKNTTDTRLEQAELKITSTAINATVSSQITEKVNGAITHTNNKFAELSITVDGITSSVSNLETKVDEDNEALQTRIEEAELKITPTAINATVSQQITTEVNGAITHTNNKFAELNTTIDGISGRVSSLNTKVDGNKTTTDSKIGALEITAGNISTKVTSVETTANRAEGKADANIEDISLAYSLINQTSDDILLEVGKKIGEDEVVSSINVQPSSVKIDTKNLDLSGNLNLRGKFANYDSVSGEKAVEISDSKLDFYDYDGSTRTTPVGVLFSSRAGGETARVGTAFNSEANASISIGYAVGTRYSDYMTFNKDGNTNGYPITAKEPIAFLSDARIFGDKRLRLGANSSMFETGGKLVIRGGNTSGFQLGSAADGPIIDWNPSTLGTYPIALRKSTAVLGYFKASSNALFESNVTIQGTLIQPTSTMSYGMRSTTTYNTTEDYVGDIGSGTINEDGECLVYIDDIFTETINTNVNYHVFTQKYNGNIDEIIREKNYFIVKGAVGTEFSWEIKAKRKGYEGHRLEVPQDEFEVNVEPSSIENDNYSILSTASKEDKELNEILNGVLEFSLVDELLI